ncbi:MAG: hypothetical protein P8Y52_06850 [Xanthomonadales bacterium]
MRRVHTMMRDGLRGLLCVIALTLLLSGPAAAAISFEALEGLPPGDQYRQLSLLMLITGGTDPALFDVLQPVIERQGEDDPLDLELDDFVTPLIRIVDRETILASAAGMFRFAHDNSAEIQQRLTRIARENPILVSMVDVNEMAADAIIIRNSIADTIEYTESIDAEQAEARLRAFRAQTVYLRNMMEFNAFQDELNAITDEAIVDLGGRLDAYQRMFSENIDEDLVRRRVESAQIMNEQTGKRFDDQAMANNAELLMMLILMESQVY